MHGVTLTCASQGHKHRTSLFIDYRMSYLISLLVHLSIHHPIYREILLKQWLEYVSSMDATVLWIKLQALTASSNDLPVLVFFSPSASFLSQWTSFIFSNGPLAFGQPHLPTLCPESLPRTSRVLPYSHLYYCLSTLIFQQWCMVKLSLCSIINGPFLGPVVINQRSLIEQAFKKRLRIIDVDNLKQLSKTGWLHDIFWQSHLSGLRYSTWWKKIQFFQNCCCVL